MTITGKSRLGPSERLSVNCHGMIGAIVGKRNTVAATPVFDGFRK
jgi:hypothetical protein